MVVGDSPNDTGIGLTRAGSFSPDADGYLRNNQGQYLRGINLSDLPAGADEPDMAAGNLEPVNISGINYRPQPTGDADVATSDITFRGNLPRNAPTGDTFQSEVTYVDAAGDNRTLTLEWSRSGDNQFNLTVTNDNNTLEGDFNLNFNDGTSGEPLGSFSEIVSVNGSTGSFSSNGDGTIELTPDEDGAQAITLDVGTPADTGNNISGMDRATMLDGEYTVTNLTSDGAAFSTVESVELGDNGMLQAVFENGDSQNLYRIPVATVNSPNELQAVGEQTFRPGPASGEVTFNTPGQGAGSLVGGALEQSNVDMSQELTDLIVTQRTYAANGSSVRTADQMLQRTVQLKR
jgi:flagellar hook protein FlgE